MTEAVSEGLLIPIRSSFFQIFSKQQNGPQKPAPRPSDEPTKLADFPTPTAQNRFMPQIRWWNCFVSHTQPRQLEETLAPPHLYADTGSVG